MMNFRYSVYGRIRVRLTGVLHIGGEPEDDAVTEKDAAALARDGEGRYIIPASGLAGVVRHFLEERESETGEQQNDVDRMLAFFGGSEAGENRIYFYDGICENVMLERRAGSRMDHAMGTAQEGGLHAKVCLAPGMTTVLPLQFFAEDEEKRETAVKLIQEIAGALDSGRIKLGAGTANGAGTFRVQKISYRSLDLQDRHDLDRYLEGLDDLLTGQGEGWKELTWEKVPEPDQFILTVDAPEGILVKNYSQTDIADAVNVSFCIADDADTLHYYIPGTSFKGVLRTGAEKIWSTLHLPAEDLEQIFGSAPDSQNNRQKSHIYVRDTEIPEPTPYIYNRIRVNRWLGGVMTGAKMNEQIIYPSEKHPMSFCAAVAERLPDRLAKEAEAVLFLLLRDIGTGRLTLGSESSIGLGRCRGIRLQWNGRMMEFRNGCISCDESTEKELQGLLASLQSQEESV